MNENPTIDPAPPDQEGLADREGLVWRLLSHNDLAALGEIAWACHLADGGLGFMFAPDVLESRYFPEASGAAIGAFDPDGRLAACAAVHLDGDLEAQRAVIAGQVRPDLRNRGLGAYLMRWSLAQARSLPASLESKRLALQVTNEALTPPADRLYRLHGFESVMEELVMRRDLRTPLPERRLPPGVTLTCWETDLAGQFYQAYHAAFRERPGFPGWSAAEWIGRVTENDFKPEWTFLARAGKVPLGFVIGTIDLTSNPPGGYVWQIGVIPAWRRLGIASALLLATMRQMQAAGVTPALLAVHVNNPGAIEAYARLGFETIGRRARYERVEEAAVDLLDPPDA